ncbi:MAG: hypothetical protein MNSN_01240 [Minisyncoccus archaeiphilus]|uniref:hypothetical protein n=1 Tax=Minisyncoccus archaeiphilus TaxID=3238481 RepID=UPI002B0C0A69|nr:MAG: hypothetical protein MNSN_01240 [Candidatus Parcubacteria bacterium]
MKYFKKVIIFSLWGVMIAGLVLANDALELHQEYPVIGIAPQFGVDFFVYLLNFSIVGGTIIALIGLTYQGINILTAGENAGQVTEAKKSIKGLFLGLTILAGSTLMLKAINPQLLEMNLNDLVSEVDNLKPLPGDDVDRPLVQYTEIPIGAVLESILNAVSTSPSQAYNYSSVKVDTSSPSVPVQKRHTEEICYLYDEYGNAIDKNGDGAITEMDEYQGVDFRICINELLKAAEHKMLFLNDGNYRCGIPGNNDEDSPLGNPPINNWNDDPELHYDANGYFNPDYSGDYDISKEGKTALNVNYHDWDKENWMDLNNGNDSARTNPVNGDPVDDAGDNTVEVPYIPPELRCRYWGNCEEDGLHGIINNLKEYIRNGCMCSETDERTSNLYNPEYVGCEGTVGGGVSPMTDFYCHSKSGCGVWCDINCNDGGPGCCGGPRGRSASCQSPQFNNILNPANPYYQHDPCMKRKSMDCMREFINIIVYGDVNTELSCPAQEVKQGPSSPIKMGWKCNDFVYNNKPEITQARKTEFLLAYYQRLISFKKYYRARMEDLEKVEKYMMKDKRLELYSKGEFQALQRETRERYSFSQDVLNLSYPYETGTYRKRFNCNDYEDPVELNKKNIYEDDEYRKNMFTCNWGEDQYNVTQKDNRIIRIRTGELISNLHVDKSMEKEGPNSKSLVDDEEDRRICSKGELETLQGSNTSFNNVSSTCPGSYGTTPELGGAPGAVFDTTKRRFVQWKDEIYDKAGYSYLNGEEQYWTGEDMAIDGDPLTFYALTKPEEVIDPYYTGRDKMPYYFKPAFIDYSQYSENSAIDTEIGIERGFLIPSLVPVGQLSYHTKIYTRQMIRMIDRTLQQMEAVIVSFDNIANVYVEGGGREGGGDYSGISKVSNETGIFSNGGARSTGCDCKLCRNRSDCYCAASTIACGCILAICTDTCSACKPLTQNTCFACSKVTRYTKFLTPSYTAYYGKNNSEPVVEDIINDNLPASLKMIVHDMSCSPTCDPGEAGYDYRKITDERRRVDTGSAYGEIELARITFDWDGVAEVGISKENGRLTPIWIDDKLWIKNLTNGKEITFLEGNERSVLVGGINQILTPGQNELVFIMKDIGDHHVGISEAWLYIAVSRCETLEYEGQLVTPAGGRNVNAQYEEVSLATINVEWDGSEQILISSDQNTPKDVSMDDALIIKNHTNGQQKEYKAPGVSVWSGHVDIMDILSAGNNELEFIAKDYHAHWIGWSNIYVLKAHPVSTEGNCECKGGKPAYVPPKGYTVVECNAWDRDLMEERPCFDYKNDIVVYLEAERTDEGCPCHEKPVIYFYPEKKQDVQVRLDYKGKIVADYPKYSDLLKGWDIIAYPDGKIVNKEDGEEYSYIFWEGVPDKKMEPDMSKGFVVKGVDTREFLQAKLEEIGLIPKEYNEFIAYWYPRMKDNEYNLIHFVGEEYTDISTLNISPTPDSVLRVFMVYKALENPVTVEPQRFDKFERKGFTVVEWGGAEDK